uniref:Uncharacterized protein n=1 Tax=Chromera velia CCMP2878 TaxID=1169474 RepID=A0A0G4ICH1_9ALVE|eukprot:Cvel_13156.t1-p1 / transcript=Cvel_13156.t1 / gene=Cvel_13156 / organism=Chromera_velia_CCMP2878 / gene_product=hypothetical protein / transcript_product=hypothetical protein / location=Cvel_scaffold888:18469-20298(+) / protein_length=530 / sequence_SO=supercontig / SO=protein_coding / is_pseudo=false
MGGEFEKPAYICPPELRVRVRHEGQGSDRYKMEKPNLRPKNFEKARKNPRTLKRYPIPFDAKGPSALAEDLKLLKSFHGKVPEHTLTPSTTSSSSSTPSKSAVKKKQRRVTQLRLLDFLPPIEEEEEKLFFVEDDTAIAVSPSADVSALPSEDRQRSPLQNIHDDRDLQMDEEEEDSVTDEDEDEDGLFDPADFVCTPMNAPKHVVKKKERTFVPPKPKTTVTFPQKGAKPKHKAAKASLFQAESKPIAPTVHSTTTPDHLTVWNQRPVPSLLNPRRVVTCGCNGLSCEWVGSRGGCCYCNVVINRRGDGASWGLRPRIYCSWCRAAHRQDPLGSAERIRREQKEESADEDAQTPPQVSEVQQSQTELSISAPAVAVAAAVEAGPLPQQQVEEEEEEASPSPVVVVPRALSAISLSSLAGATEVSVSEWDRCSEVPSNFAPSASVWGALVGGEADEVPQRSLQQRREDGEEDEAGSVVGAFEVIGEEEEVGRGTGTGGGETDFGGFEVVDHSDSPDRMERVEMDGSVVLL